MWSEPLLTCCQEDARPLTRVSHALSLTLWYLSSSLLFSPTIFHCLTKSHWGEGPLGCIGTLKESVFVMLRTKLRHQLELTPSDRCWRINKYLNSYSKYIYGTQLLRRGLWQLYDFTSSHVNFMSWQFIQPLFLSEQISLMLRLFTANLNCLIKQRSPSFIVDRTP